jgi:hypothetical protein
MPGGGRSLSDLMRNRTPTHGYEATREATAMAAFAKSWRRERQSWCTKATNRNELL